MLKEQFIERIAREVKSTPDAVRAAVDLLHHGARVAYIARYKRDATGDLRESKLRIVQQRMVEYNAIEQRRTALVSSLEEKGWLTPELRQEIETCVDPEALDDLYQLFRKQKGSQADRARERGLSSFAELIWMQDPNESDIAARAAEYVDTSKGVETPDDAIAGALEILKERIALDRDTRREIRQMLLEHGELAAHPTEAADGKRTKFESYYKYREKLSAIPSHRLLALSRGSRRGILRTELCFDEAALLETLRAKYIKDANGPFAAHIESTLAGALSESLRPHCEEQAMAIVRRAAEEHAIEVFCDNAYSVYLQPPAGAVSVLALEAGIDDACGVAVVDASGACTHWESVEGTPDEVRAAVIGRAVELATEHKPAALAISANAPTRQIAIGIREHAAQPDPAPYVVLVNGSGLSAYATSEAADAEFGEIPKVARAAVALARRHQDPLRELAKIDPRAVGAGQYYQEINQKRLNEALGLVLESCVDSVGADVNAADAHWMSLISGLQPDSASNVVAHRKEQGTIADLASLAEIRGVGPKVYEQSVGFLFVKDGTQPLDRTRIHPNHYALVERAAESAGTTSAELVGNEEVVRRIDWAPFEADAGGPKGLSDIQYELANPGTDPRRRFAVSSVHGKLRPVSALNVGEQIDGIVTNITDFGAFVDVGTKQDGLVHLSEMSHQYVSDPHRIVRLGQQVVVKVTAVDAETPRISLSMKAAQRDKTPAQRSGSENAQRPRADGDHQEPRRKPRKDKPRKQDRKRKPASRGAKSPQPAEPKEQMNTQLADQLAALRDKLGSTE